MRTFSLALTALALTFFSLAAASAADFYKLKMTATASKELRVHAYTHTDATCESKEPPPEIELNIPPTGGVACVRPGMVRLQYPWSDRIEHCIGKRISGVFVIYIPFAGFTGPDTMQYTVRVQPSPTRTYEAEITVVAGQATAASASSPPSELQKAGAMPACPALVS
jgi:hypothetical protein